MRSFNTLSSKAEVKLGDIERRERIFDLEQSGGGPAETSRGQFESYLRGGSPLELRSLTVGSVGVVGDRPFYKQFVTSMKTFAGVREAGATIIPTANGNPLTVPIADDTANVAQVVAEATTDNTAADPTVGNKILGAYKFDSKWIKLSSEMVQDADFPVEEFVRNTAAERIGRRFNTLSTTGAGTTEPTGFIGSATVGVTAAATNAITYENLLDLVHSVDSAYRNSGRAVFQFHDTTLAAIRKLKDGDNRYIFSAGEGGAPGTIAGYRYIVNNDMAQLTSGVSSKVAAFGDFSKYFVRDVTTPEVVVAKELFAGDGLMGYRVFSRHDGVLADIKAVKTLRLAAS